MSRDLTGGLPQRVRIYSVEGAGPTLGAEEGRGHGVPTIFPMAMETEPMQESLPLLTSSAEDSHAKTSRWLDAVRDWLERDPDYSTSSCALLVSSLPVGFSSRTSLAFSRRTKEGTWEPSSGRWGTSGMGGPTGCLTLNTSDHPSDGSVCSLSDILEARVPRKFFLSPKACRGILRRAAKRGKELPPSLKSALERTATGTETETE